jgi:signal transduction histidine kinase
MRRRAQTGRKAGKKAARTAVRSRRVAKAKVKTPSRRSAAELEKQLSLRTSELDEALTREAASSEVLRILASSPGKIKTVFQAILANATRVCQANHGTLYLCEADGFRVAATHNMTAAYANARRSEAVLRPPPGTPLGDAARTKQVAHFPDLRAAKAYIDRHPFIVTAVELGGYRTSACVPMLKDGELIGAITIARTEVLPFTEQQIELVKNFASQAVIAIENTRLLNELRQRTDDLSEALEQQTATSEVLQVISSSPGELRPVFDAMLRNAVRVCGAKFGNMFSYDGENFRIVAQHNASPQYDEWLRSSHRWSKDAVHPDTPLAQIARRKALVQIENLKEGPAYAAGDPRIVALVDLGGARALIGVPILNDGALVGAITIYDQEVRAFTAKQIELLANFAAQAVIAIENTRLLSELRESLQQQTATADVLKVISRSTFDLKTVLRTLVESATRLCEADMGIISRPINGKTYRIDASYGLPHDLVGALSRSMLKMGKGSATGRAALTRATVHILDAQTDPDYELKDALKVGDWHSMIGVPLLRDGNLVGVFALSRKAIRAFTEKQIELVTTFADQAVIAIENVRLFDEIQDKSQQLAEASQHKSQFLANMSHELRTPLNAILGYTELIQDGIYGEPPERMHAVLKRVQSNGKHLLGLINDVLDLSKIEAGQLTLDLADYSLGDVAQSVYSAVEPLAADKKLSFKAEVAPDLPRGRGDERRLTQVLLNLVGNAIKFTDAGEIVIKATASNGSFDLSVRDTGPGISAADQAKLFQEFQQADNSITKKKGGTGLGLAISKRIVELHGGRIWLESTVGEGSTFFVTLPMQAVAQPKPRPH